MTRNEGDDGIVVVVCGNTRDVEEVPFFSFYVFGCVGFWLLFVWVF